MNGEWLPSSSIGSTPRRSRATRRDQAGAIARSCRHRMYARFPGGQLGERARLAAGGGGLGSEPRERPADVVGRAVVEEDVARGGLVPDGHGAVRVGHAAGVRAKHGVVQLGLRRDLLREASSELGNERTQEDEPRHGTTRRHQRDRQSREGVPDQHEIACRGNRPVDHLGVALGPGRPVLARKVHGERPVPERLEERNQALPAPRPMPRAVDERERRHASDRIAPSLRAGKAARRLGRRAPRGRFTHVPVRGLPLGGGR